MQQALLAEVGTEEPAAQAACARKHHSRRIVAVMSSVIGCAGFAYGLKYSGSMWQTSIVAGSSAASGEHCVTGAVLAPPPLPKQGALQADLCRRAAAEAALAAPVAMARLLELAAAPATRHFLRQLDSASKLHLLEPEELLRRLRAELQVAELVHNFGASADPAKEGNCGLGVTLQPEKGPGAPYFYTGWMLQALGLIPVDVKNNVYTDAAERFFFGYPPFPNASCPDVATASQRPTYAALNMYRSSGGNPQCGPVSAVFSRRWVGSRAIAAPFDTGLFVDFCGLDAHGPADFNGVRCLRCEVWPPERRPLGVPDLFDHLLPTYLEFFNATQEIAGDEYVEYNFARLLLRSLSRRTYSQALVGSGAAPLELNLLESLFGYLEVNPMVTLDFPQGVLMLVGLFDILFGTAAGAVLRDWCIDQGWPLAWAHNPLISTWNCGPSTTNCQMPTDNFSRPLQSSNLRLLDPFVLRRVPEGHNLTRSESFEVAELAFEDAWRRATTAPRDTTAVLDGLWASLREAQVSVLAVEPVYHAACTSPDCIGVRISDGSCVCREAANA